MSRVLSRLILKPEQLAALGSVVAESTYVEMLVDGMICRLAKLKPQQFSAFLGGAMLQRKLEVLEQLGEPHIKSARRKAAFKKLMLELRDGNTERTKAVHGVWLFAIEGNTLKLDKAEATHTRRGKIAARDLEQLANRISNGFWALSDFDAKVWQRPAARRRVLRSKSRG